MTARLTLDLIIESAAWEQADKALLTVVNESALAAAKAEPDLCGNVAILLTDDETIRDLNDRFRAQDKPTNVLSFPAHETAEEMLGDVALAFETCEREAREREIRLADHVAHLTVHGLLHLVGYDHQMDEEAAEMEEREGQILARLGIASPYETQTNGNDDDNSDDSRTDNCQKTPLAHVQTATLDVK